MNGSRGLLTDVYMFVLIVTYWIFVLTVMLPLRCLDRACGTRCLGAAIRLTKYIGNL